MVIVRGRSPASSPLLVQLFGGWTGGSPFASSLRSIRLVFRVALLASHLLRLAKNDADEKRRSNQDPELTPPAV